MPKIKYQYDSDGCIRCGDWKFRPWPAFRVEAVRESHRSSEQALREIMTVDDAFCLLWRGQIPEPVIHALMRFPAFPPEALEIAQLNPGRFVELCETAPILAMIIWSLDEIRGGVCPGRLRAEQEKLLNSHPERTVEAVGFPVTARVCEILRKVGPDACTVRAIRTLLKAVHCPVRRRFLERDRIDAPTIEKLYPTPYRLGDPLDGEAPMPPGDEISDKGGAQ